MGIANSQSANHEVTRLNMRCYVSSMPHAYAYVSSNFSEFREANFERQQLLHRHYHRVAPDYGQLVS